MYPVLILRSTATATAHANDIYIVGPYRLVQNTITTLDGATITLLAAGTAQLVSQIQEVAKYGVVEIS